MSVRAVNSYLKENFLIRGNEMKLFNIYSILFILMLLVGTGISLPIPHVKHLYKKILIGLALVFALSAQCSADETGITGTWKGTFEGQNVQMYSVVFKFKETDKTSGGNRNFTGIYRAKNKNTGRISKGFIEGTLENEGDGTYHLSFEGKQTKPCKGKIKNAFGNLYSKDEQIHIANMKISDCQGKIVIRGTLDRQQILQP